MNVTQIYALVNSVNNQMWGKSAITVNDLTGLIALGDSVFSSTTDRDKYLNTLVDRIGKTVIRNLDAEVEFPEFIRNEFEMGAILAKLNVQLMSAQSNESWNIGNNNFTPNQFKIDKPKVYQSLFKGVTTWEFDLTIPDTLFRSAFTSESEMASFISGIMGAFSDSMTLTINDMSHAALANLIAEKIKADNGVIHALTMYNTLTGQTVTADQAKTNPAVYKYIGMLMRNYMTYLSKPSALYNTGLDGDQMVRATQRDNMHVIINADWASGYATYLESDTYHNDLIKMPLYKEIVCWQGTGNTAPNFDDNTSINVKPSSGGDAIEKDGIIGVFADRQAVGTFYNDRFTATDRNNRNRYTNYTSGATIGWFNDLSENCVVWILD